MRPAARILVVDDEPNARSALTELLRDEGYEVSSAVDGGSARAHITDFHPDLVLSEIRISGLDGCDLIAAARAQKNAPAIVFMSARPQPSRLDAPFVDKPIEIGKLMATVEDALRRRRDASAPL
jgi:two-component system response regulator HydG